MKEMNYRPTGELEGDSKAMPDKGVGTGWAGMKDTTGGMSTDATATNTEGKLGGTKSDPWDQCFTKDQY